MRITERAMTAIKLGLTIAQFTGTPQERLDAVNTKTDIEDLVPDQCELCGACHDSGEAYCGECSDDEESGEDEEERPPCGSVHARDAIAAHMSPHDEA